MPFLGPAAYTDAQPKAKEVYNPRLSDCSLTVASVPGKHTLLCIKY